MLKYFYVYYGGSLIIVYLIFVSFISFFAVIYIRYALLCGICIVAAALIVGSPWLSLRGTKLNRLERRGPNNIRRVLYWYITLLLYYNSYLYIQKNCSIYVLIILLFEVVFVHRYAVSLKHVPYAWRTTLLGQKRFILSMSFWL